MYHDSIAAERVHAGLENSNVGADTVLFHSTVSEDAGDWTVRRICNRRLKSATVLNFALQMDNLNV